MYYRPSALFLIPAAEPESHTCYPQEIADQVRDEGLRSDERHKAMRIIPQGNAENNNPDEGCFTGIILMVCRSGIISRATDSSSRMRP